MFDCSLIKVILYIECLIGSQLLYCITDRDITKHIKSDTCTLSIWATFDNFGSTNSQHACGTRRNVYIIFKCAL